MSKSLRNTLILLAIVVAAAALVLVGMYIGRGWSNPMGYGSWSMMNGYAPDDEAQRGYGAGLGMMGSYDQHETCGFNGSGMMGGARMGAGMMGGAQMGAGMMGSYGSNPLFGVDPLSLSAAEEAVGTYLDALGNDDLILGEMMIFDNHAYAQIREQSTGIGAMEVLVDPATQAVSPEFGPNMMWNLKYSPMAGSGMMTMMSGRGTIPGFAGRGSMMGGQTPDDLSADMPIGADEAVELAQRYLDSNIPGTDADQKADPFYGYYTLHIEKDGATIGMLSVHGYTGEVFVHTWHGNLIEMSESH